MTKRKKIHARNSFLFSNFVLSLGGIFIFLMQKPPFCTGKKITTLMWLFCCFLQNLCCWIMIGLGVSLEIIICDISAVLNWIIVHFLWRFFATRNRACRCLLYKQTNFALLLLLEAIHGWFGATSKVLIVYDDAFDASVNDTYLQTSNTPYSFFSYPSTPKKSTREPKTSTFLCVWFIVSVSINEVVPRCFDNQITFLLPYQDNVSKLWNSRGWRWKPGATVLKGGSGG